MIIIDKIDRDGMRVMYLHFSSQHTCRINEDQARGLVKHITLNYPDLLPSIGIKERREHVNPGVNATLNPVIIDDSFREKKAPLLKKEE